MWDRLHAEDNKLTVTVDIGRRLRPRRLLSIPIALREQVVQLVYGNGLVRQQTVLELISRKVFLPIVRQDIDGYIPSCKECRWNTEVVTAESEIASGAELGLGHFRFIANEFIRKSVCTDDGWWRVLVGGGGAGSWINQRCNRSSFCQQCSSKICCTWNNYHRWGSINWMEKIPGYIG